MEVGKQPLVFPYEYSRIIDSTPTAESNEKLVPLPLCVLFSPPSPPLPHFFSSFPLHSINTNTTLVDPSKSKSLLSTLLLLVIITRHSLSNYQNSLHSHNSNSTRSVLRLRTACFSQRLSSWAPLSSSQLWPNRRFNSHRSQVTSKLACPSR